MKSPRDSKTWKKPQTPEQWKAAWKNKGANNPNAMDTTPRWMSRYNGSWLDSTWVVLGLSSRRRASYRSFCFRRDVASLERWSDSLAQTILCCSLLLWWGDKNSGYEEGQWGPIAIDDESESWSNSKGTQSRGIGRSGRDVVVFTRNRT